MRHLGNGILRVVIGQRIEFEDGLRRIQITATKTTVQKCVE